jgi:hypothetical protein
LEEPFNPDSLAAVSLNRTKDKLKAGLLLGESSLDPNKLDEILEKHGIKRNI